jgi:hypothetical protein
VSRDNHPTGFADESVHCEPCPLVEAATGEKERGGEVICQMSKVATAILAQLAQELPQLRGRVITQLDFLGREFGSCAFGEWICGTEEVIATWDWDPPSNATGLYTVSSIGGQGEGPGPRPVGVTAACARGGRGICAHAQARRARCGIRRFMSSPPKTSSTSRAATSPSTPARTVARGGAHLPWRTAVIRFVGPATCCFLGRWFVGVHWC